MSARDSRASLGGPALEGDDGTQWYLLFAGSDPSPRGGLGDLVGTFTTEATARQAFRHIRLSQTSQRSWAQLAVVDGDQGIRTLAWFGIGATPARKPLARPDLVMHLQTKGGVVQAATLESPTNDGRDFEPTAPRRHFRRIAVWLTGLVLVGVTTVGVLSDDGTTRPVTPKPAAVNGVGPADAPAVPSPVDRSAVVDGPSSVDG